MSNFYMHRECFEAIKSLHNNADTVITKADKSNTVVILNETDYFTKKHVIWNSQKFQEIGPVDTYDKTAKIEGIEGLLNLVKSKSVG